MAASSRRKGSRGSGDIMTGIVLRAGPRPTVDLDFEGNAHFSCARCGAAVSSDMLFCPDCHTGIGWVRPSCQEYRCGGCGEPLERQWKFCPSCTCEIDWD